MLRGARRPEQYAQPNGIQNGHNIHSSANQNGYHQQRHLNAKFIECKIQEILDKTGNVFVGIVACDAWE